MAYKEEYIPNELLLTHNGINIYYTYKNDDVASGERTYGFGTAEDTADEGDDCNFDVRDLPTWDKNVKYDDDTISRTIIKAIESGDLKQWIDAAADRERDQYPPDFLNAIYDRRDGLNNDMYQIGTLVRGEKFKSTAIYSKQTIITQFNLTEEQFTNLLKPNEG